MPSLEVVAAIGLFIGTLAADRAAYRGDFALPGWVISGSADAARQILTTIAAAIITVVGVGMPGATSGSSRLTRPTTGWCSGRSRRSGSPAPGGRAGARAGKI